MKVKLIRSVTFPSFQPYEELTFPKDTVFEATQLGPHHYKTQYGYLYRGECEPV
jgi:hypothetical protein